MILILIILIIFLTIRKNNCSYKTNEKFSNISSQNDLLNNEYFNLLKIDIDKKQSIRNLLF